MKVTSKRGALLEVREGVGDGLDDLVDHPRVHLGLQLQVDAVVGVVRALLAFHGAHDAKRALCRNVRGGLVGVPQGESVSSLSHQTLKIALSIDCRRDSS